MVVAVVKLEGGRGGRLKSVLKVKFRAAVRAELGPADPLLPPNWFTHQLDYQMDVAAFHAVTRTLSNSYIQLLRYLYRKFIASLA